MHLEPLLPCWTCFYGCWHVEVGDDGGHIKGGALKVMMVVMVVVVVTEMVTLKVVVVTEVVMVMVSLMVVMVMVMVVVSWVTWQC